MSLTLAELLGSPDHYLHSFEGDAAVYVPMDAAAYHRSIFLDARISPAGEGAMQVPLRALGAVADEGLALGWIFHVAHCGSTLLARALEALGDNLVLKEPAALRQLGFAPDAARLDLVLNQLARRYRAELPTLVKANVPVNFLVPDLAARRPGDAAVLLYWNLADYLTAILRSDNHRGWLRNVTANLPVGVAEGASDAVRAAALWAAQMERFGGALGAMPKARSLDAARFFTDPAGAVRDSAALFGMATTPAQIEELVAGPLFASYSKRPDIAFTDADRQARAAEVAAAIAGEIAEAEDWLAAQGAPHGALEARIAAGALG